MPMIEAGNKRKLRDQSLDNKCIFENIAVNYISLYNLFIIVYMLL